MITMKNEISLGNLLSIGSMVVAVALAYGVMSERMSNIEKRVAAFEVEKDKTDRKYDDIKDKLAVMTGEQKVANLLIAQLSETLKLYTQREGSIPPPSTVQPRR